MKKKTSNIFEAKLTKKATLSDFSATKTTKRRRKKATEILQKATD